MTEDEAKTKWCPFVRHASELESGDLGPSSNRWLGWNHHGIGEPAACIASACMAWRWESYERAEDGHMRWNPKLRGDGYCGLGGTP